MKKAHKIIYWIATLWLALGMFSSGIIQLLRSDAEVMLMTHLGYPSYFLLILGFSKIVGVIAILIPGYALLKEWSYAGFFFTMVGAIFSHIAVADPITQALPAVLLLVLTLVSWYFRPAAKTVVLMRTK